MTSNKKLKTVAYVSGISLMIVLFLTNSAFAETLSYNTNVSIMDSKFSIEGFVASFVGYYKWIVLWMALLNILVSGFLALNLLSASDNESKLKYKTSLINVNTSFLTLILLGGLVTFSVGTIFPKVSTLNQANSTIALGTAFNDVGPGGKTTKEDIALATAIVTGNNAIKTKYTALVNSGNGGTGAVTLTMINDYQKVYTKVMNKLVEGNNAENLAVANKIVGINNASASNVTVIGIKDRLGKLKQDGTISDKELSTFITLIDSGVLTGEQIMPNE